MKRSLRSFEISNQHLGSTKIFLEILKALHTRLKQHAVFMKSCCLKYAHARIINLRMNSRRHGMKTKWKCFVQCQVLSVLLHQTMKTQAELIRTLKIWKNNRASPTKPCRDKYLFIVRRLSICKWNKFWKNLNVVRRFPVKQARTSWVNFWIFPSTTLSHLFLSSLTHVGSLAASVWMLSWWYWLFIVSRRARSFPTLRLTLGVIFS